MMVMIPITPTAIKVACSNCNLRELCMPMGLSEQDLERIDQLVAARKKLKKVIFYFTQAHLSNPYMQ